MGIFDSPEKKFEVLAKAVNETKLVDEIVQAIKEHDSDSQKTRLKIGLNVSDNFYKTFKYSIKESDALIYIDCSKFKTAQKAADFMTHVVAISNVSIIIVDNFSEVPDGSDKDVIENILIHSWKGEKTYIDDIEIDTSDNFVIFLSHEESEVKIAPKLYENLDLWADIVAADSEGLRQQLEKLKSLLAQES
jgi:hypothetical protein